MTRMKIASCVVVSQKYRSDHVIFFAMKLTCNMHVIHVIWNFWHFR